MTAPIGKLHDLGGAQGLNVYFYFCVSELTDVEIAAGRASGPTQEDVAGRLHQQMTENHTLPVICVRTAPRVRLEHRGTRLLHLQEERIFVVRHQ